MRRYALLYLLMPAVLGASGALAYYGVARARVERELILDTMIELAEEKVIGIESEIFRAERNVFEQITLETKTVGDTLSGTAFKSAFILDADKNVRPSGFFTARADDEGFRTLFVADILDDLELDDIRLGETTHHYGIYDGRPMMFSAVHRFTGVTSYYVVLEVDLNYVVRGIFRQYLGVRKQHLYQVVDERGEIRCCYPFSAEDRDIVEVRFANTLTGWRLRVARQDRGSAQSRTQQLVDGALIATALLIIVAGCLVLVFAVRRERRLSALKSDFISNVSHELKTPLSIISMFGEMLAMGRTKSKEQAVEYAEIIRRESVRLARLIDNVLDFAKIERGVEVYEFAPADIGEVVTRSLEISKHRLTQAELDVELDIDEDLPLLSIDANAMTLAVLNLVDNAIKYASKGKRLEISVHRADQRVVLSVRDFGPGIADEEQEQIFERFYRAKNVRLEPIRGSGIGLALVKHIAVAHGGGISVVNADGQGSSFDLWIPAKSRVH